MSDIDRILAELEQMLEERRSPESALFSTRTFADQPLIERGRDLQDRRERIQQRRQARERNRDLQERMQQRNDERAERRQQAAEQRQAERQRQQEPAPPSTRPLRVETPRPIEPQMTYQTALWPEEYDRTLRRAPQPMPTQGPGSPLPEAIREMRQMEGFAVHASANAYGSSASARLFFEQARLMEDYEDHYEFDGNFFQYFPTYASMSNHQLRGYFSWRTQVRAGNVERAPLSFAFVYVYELLCGIGTTPGEQGYDDLRSFGMAFRNVSPYDGGQLMHYLRDWLRDYAVYHNMPSKLSCTLEKGADESLLTLLTAEHALIRNAGLTPKSLNSAVSGEAPSHEDLLHALSASATYRLDESRLAKDEPELLAQVTTDVFEALVLHCAKRRKVDFVEGLFGFSYAMPKTMFASAVFYDPEPHPDCVVTVSPIESYTCTGGRWRHQLALEITDRDSELGRYLHEIDYQLRDQLHYAYPLKPRVVPKYVQNMVKKAVTARLKERTRAEEERRRAEEAERHAREEAEKRRIKIDRSKLGGIRAAAAQTREALLTDEERGLEPTAVVPTIAALGTTPNAADAPAIPADPASEAAPSTDAQAGIFVPDAAATSTVPGALEVSTTPVSPITPSIPTAQAAATPNASASCTAATTYGLTELELRVLMGLLDHTPVSELLGPTDPFVSVVADTINEKLFDLVGDTIIEFDGDKPTVIEDYLDDIREVL